MNVLEAIKIRRSVRAYSSKLIPADLLDRMKQALRYAPSACNLQPWRFILVTDPKLRQAVAGACNGQTWIADAPVTVVACGFPDQAYKKMGGTGNSIDIDLAIALDHLTLAAVAEGLGTCWIGAFKEPEVKHLLGVPETVKVVALTPLGFPASPDLIRPGDENRRKAATEIFSVNKYS
jgi:nitroreductase